MSSGKVVLVTGANRGLGYAILQVLGAQDPSTTIILASRSLESGKEAAKKLADEGVKAQIDTIQLDITNDDETIEAVKHVAIKYQKLDALVNNAGILTIIPDFSLPTLRKTVNDMCNVNLTSSATMSSAFQGLLRKSPNPVVINLTSGLGSITNTLTKKMARYPPYGVTKVAVNGLTAHMQVMENDRIIAEKEAKEKGEEKPSEGTKINYYSVAPGLLNTAFTHYSAQGKDPKEGAEAIVRLICAEKGQYQGGTQWEFEEGEMRVVPW